MEKRAIISFPCICLSYVTYRYKLYLQGSFYFYHSTHAVSLSLHIRKSLDGIKEQVLSPLLHICTDIHTFFVALKWVALPLRLLEVPSSNTFLDTSSSNCCFSCFPSSSRSLHHKHFFLHPFNLIVYWWLPHPHYIFQATDSANK